MGKKYTYAEKMHAIDLAKSMGVKAAAEVTDISESTIYKWMRGRKSTTTIKGKRGINASAPTAQKATYSPATYKAVGTLALVVGILAMLTGLLILSNGGILLVIFGLLLILGGRANWEKAAKVIAEQAQAIEIAPDP